MEQMVRLILWFVFTGLSLTLIASVFVWYYENTRRLTRALTRTLGKPADAVVFDLSGTKAAGFDFDNGDCCVLWQTGVQGLVFSFDEIEGAELIVDERVVGRAQKGETRRVLEETYSQATRVTLRLMFSDPHTPEFEVSLFGEVTQNPVYPKTAAEAVRLGRKWLSHVDAVIKRQVRELTHAEAALKMELKGRQLLHPENVPVPSPYAPPSPAKTPAKSPQPKTAQHVTNDTLADDLPY
jgi:hypothetical protein